MPLSAANSVYGIQGQFDITNIVQGANTVNRQLASIDQQGQKSSRSLSNFFKAPASQLIFLGLDLQQLSQRLALVSGAFIALEGASVKFAMSFQNNMRYVNTILKLSETAFAQFSDDVRQLSKDPTITQGPGELAKGLYQVVSAGYTGQQALKVLTAASKGATAGNADLSIVTRLLVSTMQALPGSTLTAKQVMDSFFETVDKGIIEFPELAANMGDVLAVMGAAKVPLTEVGAAIATLTRRGVQPSEAMTQLNRIILAFISPAKEAKDKAAELGLEFSLDSLRTKGLVQSLQEVDKAVGSNSESLATLMGDQRAVKGSLALLADGGKLFTQLTKSQTLAIEGEGAAARALAESLKSPGNQIKLVMKDFQNFAITLGQEVLPMMLAVMKVGRDMAGGFLDLPPVVRSIVQGLGLLSIAATGITFILATLITSIGAVINFTRQLGVALAGGAGAVVKHAGSVGIDTAALVANTGATLANSAAHAQSATIYIANSASIVTRTQQASAGLVQQATSTAALGAASVTAATATSGLVTWISRLTVAGLVVGLVWGLGEAIKSLAGSTINAASSIPDLIDKIAKLRSEIENAPVMGGWQKALDDEKSFIGGLQKAIGGIPIIGSLLPGASFTKLLEEEKQKIQSVKPDEITQAALGEATRTQRDAEARGADLWSSVLQGLMDAMGQTGDPRIEARLSQVLTDTVKGGVKSVVQTGFATLEPGQRGLIRGWIDTLDTEAAHAAARGLPDVAQTLKDKRNQILQDIGGLETTTPISVAGVFAPFLAEEQANLAKVKADNARASAELTARDKELEAAEKSLRLAQLQLSLEMRASEQAVQAAEDAVSALKDELTKAESAVKEFSSVMPIGWGAMEDAIFAVQQQLARLNLQLLDIQSAFVDPLFAAEEEVLRARLKYLELGEEIDRTNKKATFGLEDLVAAQQRELREGVPVLRTIWERITAAQQGRASEEAKTPQDIAQKELAAAERRLEILRIQQSLADIAIRKQLELTGIEERRLELTKETTLEPQLREMQKLLDITKEMTLNVFKTGLSEAKDNVITLNEKLEEANAVLLDRQAIVGGLTEQEAELTRQSTLNQIAQLNLSTETADLQAKALSSTAGFEEKIRNLQALSTEWDASLSELNKKLAIGPSKMSEITTIESAMDAANQRIGEIDSKGVEATSKFGDVLSGVAGFFSGLLDTVTNKIKIPEGLFREGFGGLPSTVPQFHEGGAVAPNLAAGTEVPALLQAGEHVLSRQTVSQLRSGIAYPSLRGGDTSNWNWDVTINNSHPNADVYGKFYREAKIRRLGGNWR